MTQTARLGCVAGPQLDSLGWPFERAGEALEALVAAARLRPPAARAATEEVVSTPSSQLLQTREGQAQWLDAVARERGVEALPVSARYPEVPALVRRAAPAVFALPAAQPGAMAAPRLLVVLERVGQQLCVLLPAGQRQHVPVQALLAALVAPIEARALPAVQALLSGAQVTGPRRRGAERTLLREQLADQAFEGCWLVRAPAHGPLTAGGRGALRRALLTLAGAYLGQYALWAFAWQRAAAGALDGATDPGELRGWLLALLSTIPLQAAISWYGARHSLDAGAWIRQRLLGGLLARGSELTRGEGLGRLLGRVLEAGAVESLGLGGGLLAGLALLDLAVAAVLLGSGAEAVPLLCLFGAALLLVAWWARRALALRAAWTRSRMNLTHDLVERMTGQRTRLVQEPPEHWHRSEDAELERHLEHARLMDAGSVRFASVPRAWLAAACAYVAFRVVPHGYAGGVPLALALGGILLGYRALATLSAGIGQLSLAWIAWQSVAPLVRGAQPASSEAPRPASLTLLPPQLRGAALEVRQLTLSAPGQTRPLLRSADVTIRPGDRALLEGASGSGKSSLARVLAGLSRAEHGSLLLGGVDTATLGKQAWRRRVSLVPQFHDNHLFGGTLAFNLLLGRAWPPSQSDLAEALAICGELGLGPLLERMPLGLQQVVGETGWQLSHGERSRVFAARALLAQADVVLLDESLAAVDPGTAHTVLDCAERRARSLILIAHLGSCPPH